MPAAAWVAAVGAALVLAASSVLVVGNWNTIRPEIKLAGLVAVGLAVVTAAEWLRSRLPVVARALAHLAAAMAVPSGVAALATIGRPWPEAVLAGGAAGVVACAVQTRRWSAPLLVPAGEIAAVLGLAGAAALTHAPLGVLIAGLATVALVRRHDAGALRLAALAPVVPLLAVLGALGVGPGTAARLGARGDVLAWAAPAAGVVAAAVLAVLAQRRGAVPLTVAALLAALAGVATGLVELRPDRLVVLALVGAALVAVAALEPRATGVWMPLARRAGLAAQWASVLAGPLGLAVAIGVDARDGMLGLAVAAWAAAAAAFAFDGVGADHPTRVPDPVLQAAGALALSGATAAFAGSRLGGLVAFAVVASALGLLTRPAAAMRIGLAVVLVPLGVASAAAGAGRWVALAAALVAGAALVVTVRAPSTDAPASLTVGAVAVAAGLAVAPAAWPSSGWALTAAWAIGLGVLVAGRRWWLAGAAAPWLPLLAAAAHGMDADVTTPAALVAAALLTAVAGRRTRTGPADVAALSAGLVALVASTGQAGGALTSVAGVALGAQAWVLGERRERLALSLAGRVVGALSLLSLPSTTGLTERVLDALRPHGVQPIDLSVGLVALALVGGGWWLRRSDASGRTGSWPAYAPGLLVAGLHLVTTQASTDQTWRAAVAIGIGVVAVAAGGVRRLGAPLVLGTALIAVASIVAGGARLAELPVWLWLAVGGAALLLVATLIERGGPPEAGAGPGERMRTVWHHFG